MSKQADTVRAFDPVAEPLGLDNDPMTYLTRVFVYFLQNLFRDFPEGCGFRWRPEEENTEIVITAEKPHSDAIEKMPHITCVLGAAQWSNLSMDQLVTVKTNGERVHSDLMSMTMAYHCQAKYGLVARRIAWYASFYTNALRRVIMKSGGLHQIDPKHSISAETGPTVYTGPTVTEEIVAVVVNVPFYWQVGWRINKPSELWREMRINFTVNSAGPLWSIGRVSKLRPPHVNGKPVTAVIPQPGPPAFSQQMLIVGEDGEE